MPTVSNPEAGFVIDPFDASFFNLGVQQDAIDYQKDDVTKRAQITFIVVCVLLLVFAGLILWLSFKSADNAIDKVSILKGAIEGLTSGPVPN